MIFQSIAGLLVCASCNCGFQTYGARNGQAHVRRANSPGKGVEFNGCLDKRHPAGVELLVNIIAMLVVLVALVYLANLIFIMAPIVWLMGVPWEEATGAVVGIIGS